VLREFNDRERRRREEEATRRILSRIAEVRRDEVPEVWL